MSWIRYRNKHGSIDAGRRVDRTLSIIAAHFSRAFVKFQDGHKVKPDEFTLYPVKKDEDIIIGPEEAFAYLSSISKKED